MSGMEIEMMDDATPEVATEMQLFYVTFGSQYSHEEHPYWDGAHPDGYVVIEAPDELTARYVAFGVFDSAWSMIYHAHEFDLTDPDHMRWYSRGEIGRISINFTTKPGRGRKR